MTCTVVPAGIGTGPIPTHSSRLTAVRTPSRSSRRTERRARARTPSRSASTSTGAGAGTEAAADGGEEASVRSCGGRGGALIAGPGRSAEPSLAGLYKYSRPRGLDVVAGCPARSGVVVPVVVRSVLVVHGMVDLVEVVRAELVQEVVHESARELVAHHPPGAHGMHPARLAQEGEGMRGRGDRKGVV